MAQWYCTACRRAFLGDERRCPSCLKRSSVVEPGVAAGGAVERGSPRGQLLIALVLAPAALAIAAWAGCQVAGQILITLDGQWEDARVIAVAQGTTGLVPRCTVTYVYGRSLRQSHDDETGVCWHLVGDPLRVRASEAWPSFTRVEGAWDVSLYLFGFAVTGFVGFALTVVALYHLWPHPRIRRLAMALGIRGATAQ